MIKFHKIIKEYLKKNDVMSAMRNAISKGAGDDIEHDVAADWALEDASDEEKLWLSYVANALALYYEDNNKSGIDALYRDKRYKPFFDMVQAEFKKTKGATKPLYRGLFISRDSRQFGIMNKSYLNDTINLQDPLHITSWTENMDVASAFAHGETEYLNKHHPTNYSKGTTNKNGVGVVCQADISYKDVIFFHDAINMQDTDLSQRLPGILDEEDEVTVYLKGKMLATIVEAYVVYSDQEIKGRWRDVYDTNHNLNTIWFDYMKECKQIP